MVNPPESPNERKATYTDFQLQELFEGLCEQILDTLGIEKGREFLYKAFESFHEEVDMKITEYEKGNRITRKLDKPDKEILRICKG